MKEIVNENDEIQISEKIILFFEYFFEKLHFFKSTNITGRSGFMIVAIPELAVAVMARLGV